MFLTAAATAAAVAAAAAHSTEGAAAEAAARKAAEEKAAAEEAARKKRLHRKIFLSISIPLAVLIAAFVVVLIVYIIPQNHYNDAAALLEAGKYDEGLLVYNTPYARRQFYLHPEGECLHGENGLRGSYWGQRALADYGEAIAYIATQAVTTFWGG